MQYEWEIAVEENNPEILNVSKENFQFLYDLWLEKSGLDKTRNKTAKQLKKYAQKLANHIIKFDAESEMFLNIAKQELESKSKNSISSSVHSQLCIAYKFNIDKKNTTVEDYLGYYINYRDGRVNI